MPKAISQSPQRVSLFIQCVVDSIYPEVAEAMLRIFERLAIVVDYPDGQTCCGQPAFNAGYRDAARQAARHFIEIFEDAPCIVCPSGSCVAMVRHHYAELFADEPAWRTRAAAVAAKTFELTEFLVDVLGVTDLGARWPGRVTYHDSCHLVRTLGVRHQPRQLLAGVHGLELVEMIDSDRCCGFGGTFAVKYPDISTAMVAEKVANILATGAQTVVGCDMVCLMNIEGYLSRHNHAVQVRHIAQILAP
ncbi:(Fe-S)-binding protein [Desulfosarcina cetonica]|uniref:(Fe-S)-binding protein n=1 Tax=Desulfosarcina cetonica TaxID=90730 RepID=UPI0006CF27BE|nr:(Fe-S)-binding protein [Desulfosarcina cetonica]